MSIAGNDANGVQLSDAWLSELDPQFTALIAPSEDEERTGALLAPRECTPLVFEHAGPIDEAAMANLLAHVVAVWCQW